MSIQALEESKKLRKAGAELDREGLSKRVEQLISEHREKYPDGHYREAMILAGRLHALVLAAKFDVYWTEQTRKGYRAECDYLFYDLPEVDKVKEGSNEA
jgi:hypothetical protein